VPTRPTTVAAAPAGEGGRAPADERRRPRRVATEIARSRLLGRVSAPRPRRCWPRRHLALRCGGVRRDTA